MSVRHEFKNGVTNTIMERERMSFDTYTLPQALKTAGYSTGIFGKWHLGGEEAYRPENRGFDDVYIHGAGGIGQTFPGSCGDAPGNTNINPTLWHNGTYVKAEGYCTDLFFDQSIRWMDTLRKSDQPFFAYVSLNAAHGPHVVPDEYCTNYQDTEGISDGLAKYLGMVENIDTNFGKLLSKISQWEIADKFQPYEIQKDWKEERDLAAAMPGRTEVMKKTLLKFGKASNPKAPPNGGKRTPKTRPWRESQLLNYTPYLDT